MKLSSNTLNVLKNYSSINKNMVFTQGNILRTFSNSKAIYSVAQIEEEIPMDFAIYDLPSMLGMLTCLDEPEIVCHENNIEIVSTNDKGSFDVFYCDMDLVVVPPTSEPNIDPIYSFKVSLEEFQHLMKSISVTGSPSLTIKCDGENVTMIANDRDNNTSSSYKKVIGKFDSKFDVYVSVENLKIIPDDYEIIIAMTKSKKTALLNFKSESKKVEYWITCGLDFRI